MSNVCERYFYTVRTDVSDRNIDSAGELAISSVFPGNYDSWFPVDISKLIFMRKILRIILDYQSFPHDPVELRINCRTQQR